jgi:DNA polymerase sigma
MKAFLKNSPAFDKLRLIVKYFDGNKEDNNCR